MKLDFAHRARAEQCVRQLLYELGEDPAREGILETPRRVVAAFEELLSGREADTGALLKVQFDAEHYDELVALRDIPFTSTCEHHLLPFTGTASVAYLPGDRVVGLSKLARLVDAHATRLQLQERMTAGIADDLEAHLQCRGAAVLVKAAHSCMACRGVKKSGSTMVTSTMRGLFRTDPAARAEVLSMIGGKA